MNDHQELRERIDNAVWEEAAFADDCLELLDELDELRTKRLPETGNSAYDLLMRLKEAVWWLRQAEDYARMTAPEWPAADRVRDIYEQITEDIYNGRKDVPTMRQQLDAQSKAIDAVSALHVKQEKYNICAQLCMETGEALWPCATRRAISDALKEETE